MTGTEQVTEDKRRTGGPVDETPVNSSHVGHGGQQSTKLKVGRSSEGVKAMAEGIDGLVVNCTKRMRRVTGVHAQKRAGVADERWGCAGPSLGVDGLDTIQ
jgi:hypothetical protein